MAGEFRSQSSIPLKSTGVATVPLFNIWTIGWNADRASHFLVGYWDAPIFYPTTQTFAFSEPQPATLLVAPVCWGTNSPVAGYKAWMFLSLALNGFFAALLLRRIGHGLFSQLVGGTAITLLPIIHQQIDVLQLVPVWGIIWFWSCVFELDKHPRPKTTIETAVSFATCFALSTHHALFLTLVFPFAAIVFVRRLADRQFLTAALTSIVIASVLILPIVLPIHIAAQTNEFSRNKRTVTAQSVKLDQYLATPKNSLIHFQKFESSPNRSFNVGWFRTLMAFGGISAAFFSASRRQWILFLLATTVSAMAFSLGLNLEIFGWKPWLWLSETLPGFGQVRNVFRFAWLVQIAVVLLAVEGLSAILAVCQQRISPSRLKPTLAVLVVVPGVLIATEIWPEPAQRGGVPDSIRHHAWTSYIRDNQTQGRPIACLPFASGNSISDFDMTTRWMIHGLEHKAPMLNGYSGFFPKSYFTLRNLVNEEFPSDRVISRFAEHDVEHLVVARKYCPPSELLAAVPDTLELVYEDEIANVDIYRLSVP